MHTLSYKHSYLLEIVLILPNINLNLYTDNGMKVLKNKTEANIFLLLNLKTCTDEPEFKRFIDVSWLTKTMHFYTYLIVCLINL